jgi:ADP-glucose pyrophosphorylase
MKSLAPFPQPSFRTEQADFSLPDSLLRIGRPWQRGPLPLRVFFVRRISLRFRLCRVRLPLRTTVAIARRTPLLCVSSASSASPRYLFPFLATPRSRLRPLTDTRPKALVEINGRTLLEITIDRLKSFGVTEAIINVHHHADMITDYLKSQNNFNMRIEISREEVLLDTGGGLKKAAWFFLENSGPNDASRQDEPFLLHNVDILSTIDLTRMLQFHEQNQALATLAVQSRESSRQLLFNKNNQLVGRRIHNENTVISSPHPAVISSEARNLSSISLPDVNATHPSSDSPLATSHSPLSQPLAFSGIHVISPRLLPMLTEQGIFSIIPAYLRLAAQNEKIQSFRADQYYWRDLGRPEDLAQAAQDMPL